MGDVPMKIEVFDDLYDAILFLEVEAEQSDFIKGELLRTDDNRYRVGVMFGDQLELDFEGE